MEDKESKLEGGRRYREREKKNPQFSMQMEILKRTSQETTISRVRLNK